MYYVKIFSKSLCHHHVLPTLFLLAVSPPGLSEMGSSRVGMGFAVGRSISPYMQRRFPMLTWAKGRHKQARPTRTNVYLYWLLRWWSLSWCRCHTRWRLSLSRPAVRLGSCAVKHGVTLWAVPDELWAIPSAAVAEKVYGWSSTTGLALSPHFCTTVEKCRLVEFHICSQAHRSEIATFVFP